MKRSTKAEEFAFLKNELELEEHYAIYLNKNLMRR